MAPRPRATPWCRLVPDRSWCGPHRPIARPMWSSTASSRSSSPSRWTARACRARCTCASRRTEDAGTVTVVTGGGGLLSAVFVPASSLAPETAYQFEVSTAALEPEREALAAPVRGGLHHRPDTAAVATVIISPSPLDRGRRAATDDGDAPERDGHAARPRAVPGARATRPWPPSPAPASSRRSPPAPRVIRATCGGAFGEATVTVVPVPLEPGVRLGERRVLSTLRRDDGGRRVLLGKQLTGQLGDGHVYVASTTPVAVAGGLTFASVSASAWHTCGVTTSGAAYCWGSGLVRARRESRHSGRHARAGARRAHLRERERRVRPRLRRDDGGRRVLLGRELLRRARRRHHDQQHHPGARRGWAHLRRGERRGRPHLRRNDHGRCLLLGR